MRNMLRKFRRAAQRTLGVLLWPAACLTDLCLDWSSWLLPSVVSIHEGLILALMIFWSWLLAAILYCCVWALMQIVTPAGESVAEEAFVRVVSNIQNLTAKNLSSDVLKFQKDLSTELRLLQLNRRPNETISYAIVYNKADSWSCLRALIDVLFITAMIVASLACHCCRCLSFCPWVCMIGVAAVMLVILCV